MKTYTLYSNGTLVAGIRTDKEIIDGRYTGGQLVNLGSIHSDKPVISVLVDQRVSFYPKWTSKFNPLGAGNILEAHLSRIFHKPWGRETQCFQTPFLDTPKEEVKIILRIKNTREPIYEKVKDAYMRNKSKVLIPEDWGLAGWRIIENVPLKPIKSLTLNEYKQEEPPHRKWGRIIDVPELLWTDPQDPRFSDRIVIVEQEVVTYTKYVFRDVVDLDALGGKTRKLVPTSFTMLEDTYIEINMIRGDRFILKLNSEGFLAKLAPAKSEEEKAFSEGMAK